MKTEMLKIRVESSEKQAFEGAAGLVGMPLSAWVRMNLRKAAVREYEEAGKRIDLSASMEVAHG